MLVPPSASVLSAFGMITADVVKDYVRTIMSRGDTPFEEAAQILSIVRGQGWGGNGGGYGGGFAYSGPDGSYAGGYGGGYGTGW